jgi:hypothetical protein
MNAAQQVWQSQATESPQMSLPYVRHQARRFEQRIRLRNGIEYATALFTSGFCGWHAWQNLANAFFAASMVCFMFFTVFCVYQWHRLATSRAAPADAGVLDTLRFQRRELERQRDARKGNWRWWLPAFLPGVILLGISTALEFDGGRLTAYLLIMGTGIPASILFYEVSAKRIQREIDALDSLASD